MSIEHILGRKEPLLYLVTHEEGRAEAAVQAYCEQQTPPLPLFRWSSTRGLEKMQRGVVESVKVSEHSDPRVQAQAPLVSVLNYIVNECAHDGVFLLRDVHHYLREGSGFNPAVALTIRALREAKRATFMTALPLGVSLGSSGAGGASGEGVAASSVAGAGGGGRGAWDLGGCGCGAGVRACCCCCFSCCCCCCCCAEKACACASSCAA